MGTGLPYLMVVHGNAGEDDDDLGNNNDDFGNNVDDLGNNDDDIIPMEHHRPKACPLTALSEICGTLKHFWNHSSIVLKSFIILRMKIILKW